MSRKIKQGRNVLSNRQRELLTLMRDTEEELVYEAGCAYVGLVATNKQMVDSLLRLCAIRLEDGCEFGGFERYTINGTGLKLLNGDTSDLELLR
jgi:hypothetical protein